MWTRDTSTRHTAAVCAAGTDADPSFPWTLDAGDGKTVRLPLHGGLGPAAPVLAD